MYDLIDNPRFARPADAFERACLASRRHSEMARDALRTYGHHGADISGCVRDHFPPDVKDKLRALAAECSRWSAIGHRCRPKHIHKSTMVRLAREIATRDGSGFYGPQPCTSGNANAV